MEACFRAKRREQRAVTPYPAVRSDLPDKNIEASKRHHVLLAFSRVKGQYAAERKLPTKRNRQCVPPRAWVRLCLLRIGRGKDSDFRIAK